MKNLLVITCIFASGILPAVFQTTPVTADVPGQTVTMIKGARPVTDEPARRVYYVSASRNEADLLAVRDRLLDSGARFVSTILPDAIVCELPLRLDPGAVMEGTDLVYRTQPLGGAVTAPALPGDLEWLRRAYDTIDARRSGIEPAFQLGPSGSPESATEVSTASIERSAWLAKQRLENPDAVSAQGDPLPDQNAEFLAGNIHIQIVFLEQKDSDSWTSTERGQVKAAVEFVKMYFEQNFRSVSPNFTSRTFDSEVGWDPITGGLNTVIDIPPLMHDVMNRLGFYGEEAAYVERVNRFCNAARSTYRNADWVFTAFVVDSSHDPDHSFESKKQIYAALGGPFMILPYPVEYPGIGNFEAYFKHGMTVVFWGLPEDLGSIPGDCDSRSGYLNYENLNRVVKTDPLAGDRDCDNEIPDPCTAKLNDMLFGYGGAPCEYTLGHLGNVDADNDNVPDIFDAPPRIIFGGAAVDTLTSLDQPVRLTVRSRAVPNQNPLQQHERISYATEIERVSYLLNGIGPVLVEPVDGIADEVVEDYEITIKFLLPGYSVIEVTAWNNFHAKSPPQEKQLYYLALDYFSFRFEQRSGGIGAAWYLRGKTFNAELELHRIDYGDSTDTIVATPEDLQPVGPPSSGLTPYYFLDRTAASGSRYGYYLRGTFDHFYDGQVRQFTSNSQVYETFAAIPRADGILSVPAPNPFQPTKGDTKLLMSVNIPGAEGIPMYTAEGGISRVSAQQTAPEPVNLKVGVYDVAGREVKVLFDEAVYDQVVNIEWDGSNENGSPVPSGMYFIKARAAETKDTKKVLVIR
jgi:hypothetical protein